MININIGWTRQTYGARDSNMYPKLPDNFYCTLYTIKETNWIQIINVILIYYLIKRRIPYDN